ncbi:MAG: hypothetical protein UU63_C0006G0001 [Candidatus Uhrbacteria bacterium GW2011_GWF2_41_430]|nr:MAG: hypothetical protein UU63_C0006G0001 [Candidatus Uhrbacteria bacterium GW2011_GWF2_41_430]
MIKYKPADPSRLVRKVAECARDFCCHDLGIVNKPAILYVGKREEGDSAPVVATNKIEVHGFVYDASALYLVLHGGDDSELNRVVSTVCHEVYHTYQFMKGLAVTEPPACEYAERMTKKIVLG